MPFRVRTVQTLKGRINGVVFWAVEDADFMYLTTKSQSVPIFTYAEIDKKPHDEPGYRFPIKPAYRPDWFWETCLLAIIISLFALLDSALMFQKE